MFVRAQDSSPPFLHVCSVIIYLQACIFADVHELSLHFLSVSQFVALDFLDEFREGFLHHLRIPLEQ